MELTPSTEYQRDTDEGHLTKSAEVRENFLKEVVFEMCIKIWLEVKQVKKTGGRENANNSNTYFIAEETEAQVG